MSSEAHELKENPGGKSRLLILTKDAAAVRGTVAFLSRRGVEVFAATSLQEVVDKISEGWSKYLLLSVNFPHPKIDIVPTLLHQSFGTEVMVFAETSDRKTDKRLKNSKSKHVIFGTPSGPVVLMRLKQMQKESEDQSQAPSESIAASHVHSESGGADEPAILLKGGQTGVTVARTEASRKDAVAKLMKALSESELPSDENGGIAGQLMGRDSGRKLSKPLSKEQKRAVKASIKESALTSMNNGAAFAENAGVRSGNELARAGEKKRGARKQKPAKIHNAIEAEKRRSEPGNIHIDEDGRTAKEQLIAEGVGEPSTVQILERCAQLTLQDCFGEPGVEKSSLIDYRSASIMVVGNQNYKGSVLVAIGRGSFDDKVMLKQIEMEFLRQISANGSELATNSIEVFEVLPASTIADGFSAAEFSSVIQADDAEVGMAYLSMVPDKPMLIPTYDNMIQIEVGDLRPDVKIDFDVFLYLPANNKYLRYFKPGGEMSAKQAERLINHQVPGLYLRKEDSEVFKIHAAITSLKNKIARKAA